MKLPGHSRTPSILPLVWLGKSVEIAWFLRETIYFGLGLVWFGMAWLGLAWLGWVWLVFVFRFFTPLLKNQKHIKVDPRWVHNQQKMLNLAGNKSQYLN